MYACMYCTVRTGIKRRPRPCLAKLRVGQTVGRTWGSSDLLIFRQSPLGWRGKWEKIPVELIRSLASTVAAVGLNTYSISLASFRFSYWSGGWDSLVRIPLLLTMYSCVRSCIHVFMYFCTPYFQGRFRRFYGAGPNYFAIWSTVVVFGLLEPFWRPVGICYVGTYMYCTVHICTCSDARKYCTVLYSTIPVPPLSIGMERHPPNRMPFRCADGWIGSVHWGSIPDAPPLFDRWSIDLGWRLHGWLCCHASTVWGCSIKQKKKKTRKRTGWTGPLWLLGDNLEIAGHEVLTCPSARLIWSSWSTAFAHAYM